jgi:hypothetical protein
VSVQGQTALYRNPGNLSGTWNKTVIINHWCHDITLADLDDDGKQDVLCSGSRVYGVPSATISFQNSVSSWQVIQAVSPSGDGVAVFTLNRRNQIVACSGTSLNWYENPGGSAARNWANWNSHYIGSCNEGVSVGTLNVGNRWIAIVASNETGDGHGDGDGVWEDGLAYFDPGSNYYGRWTENIVDNSYRDVHEIASDTLNGVPFFTVGEQDQASSICNNSGHNDHPNVSGCRVAIFPWNGRGFSSPTLLSDLGTQNQSLAQMNGTEYMDGANHNYFGAADPGFHLWTFTINRGTSPPAPPPPGGSTAGTYYIYDNNLRAKR